MNMWDQRFSQEEYLYGEEPNAFFKEYLSKYSPGKILFPAEGEGRNAVYAAKMEWDVYAFDNSIEGQAKAERLATKNKVSINYVIESYDSFQTEENSFDMIVLIYAHHSKRAENHQKLIRFLKPGGVILLEGFSKEQINNNTGGPPSLDLLFSEKELKSDFESLKSITIWEENQEIYEGKGHAGMSAVIRMIGIK